MCVALGIEKKTAKSPQIKWSVPYIASEVTVSLEFKKNKNQYTNAIVVVAIFVIIIIGYIFFGMQMG